MIFFSMKKSAEEAGVLIVAGDTKVVGRLQADVIFITTTCICIIDHDQQISSLQPFRASNGQT